MIPVYVDPAVHHLQDTPFQRYIRKHMRDESLFTFRHARTGNWILAFWVNKLKGLLMELLVLGGSCQPTRAQVKQLEQWDMRRSSNANRFQRNLRRIQQIDRTAAEGIAEEDEEERDVWDHWNKRGSHVGYGPNARSY